jgi:hypothetical protein
LGTKLANGHKSPPSATLTWFILLQGTHKKGYSVTSRSTLKLEKINKVRKKITSYENNLHDKNILLLTRFLQPIIKSTVVELSSNFGHPHP